jgi:hypothetical protein
LCTFQYWSNCTKTCLYNVGCWIYTSNCFHLFLVCLTDITTTIKCSLFSMFDFIRYVKSVFVIHVGGTRGVVTSSTDHILKRQARITLKVECIRTCIFVFLLHVWIQRTSIDQD